MVRINGPEWGTVQDNPAVRKYTSCGADPQPVPCAGHEGDRAGIPAGILACAGILILVVAAVILYPHLSPALSGISSAGPASPGQTQQAILSTDSTPLPGTTPLPLTGTPEPTISAVVSTAPAVISLPTTVPATTETIAGCRTSMTVTPAIVTPTETVVPKVTSQITLAETWIPEQPSADSYVSTTPGAPAIDHTALEARIHELINVQREQNGLSELSYDSFLADIARGHSYDMVLRNYFEHVDPDGKNAKARGDSAGYPCIRGYRNSYTEGLSENLYQGYRGSTYVTDPNGTIVTTSWNSLDQIAGMAVTGWMNSEGHRRNILNANFQQEGIGIAYSADDKVYVTENFC